MNNIFIHTWWRIRLIPAMAGRFLELQCHSGLHNEFQDSEGCIVGPCLKNKLQQNNNI